jgi:hypothetical protein
MNQNGLGRGRERVRACDPPRLRMPQIQNGFDEKIQS